MLDTQDGEKLKITIPFGGEYMGETIEESYRAVIDDLGMIHTVPTNKVFDTEIEDTQNIIKEIKFFYKWHSKPSNAPAANVDVWKEKAQQTIVLLKEKYLEKYP